MIGNKKIVCFLLAGMLFIQDNTAYSQKMKLKHLTTFDDKLLHFGFTLGINTLDFRVRGFQPIGENPAFSTTAWQLDPALIDSGSIVTADIANLIPGFTVGIITNLRMTRYLDLRFLPGMSFGERKLMYNIPVVDNRFDYKDTQYDYSMKSTFIDLPLTIKYKAERINNGRPYVIFGGAMRIDISKSASDDLVGLTPVGYYAELGAGWDSYLQFFRLSVEAKVSLGLNNQLGKAPETADQRHYYADALKSLHSNIFTLSFHFE